MNGWSENRLEDPGARARVELATCRLVKKVHVVGSLGFVLHHAPWFGPCSAVNRLKIDSTSEARSGVARGCLDTFGTSHATVCKTDETGIVSVSMGVP